MKKTVLYTFFETAFDAFPLILGIVSSLITIIDHFSKGPNLFRLSINLLILIPLTCSYLKLQKKKKLSSGLTLLAKDGHIHTTRTLILRDNFKELAKTEHHYDDITKQNDFHAQNVTFSFHVSSKNNGISDLVYHHRFTFAPLHKGEQIFAPWFFGEDEAIPIACQAKINDQSWLNVVPTPIVSSQLDYAANEGIYTAAVPLGQMQKDECKTLEFQYTREATFRWNRKEILVIWPKCFAKELKKANFSVTFEDNASMSIDIYEYVCHGKKPLKRAKACLQKLPTPNANTNNAVVEYRIEDLHIDEDNVYVIYLTNIVP